LPIGAEVLREGGVDFRVWAPRTKRVKVQLFSSATSNTAVAQWALAPEAGGYFSGHCPQAAPGMCYKFQIDSGEFPDPASRFQPQGPHGPSQIIDPSAYPWRDRNWSGVTRSGLVIYEMHIGTLTPEGTFRSATERLPELARLGVTLLEIMPVADFAGRFGWGYDGVNLFAPTRLYGSPDEFRAFVDQAHALGLGVILDVVYNHLGPDGNYLKEFSLDYFTDRYANEWGEAINFDGENSGPVREYFISNARYWIEEFHLDGLRLDATQQIFDASPENILTAINHAVRCAAGGRSTFIVAENEPQHTRLIRAVEQGGCGLDALWNDDFHHSAWVALTGRVEAYYTDYRGTPQEFISTAKWNQLYQGQWYSWQKQRRGSPALDLHPNQFVTFLENHDQVANSLRGLRLHQMTNPGRLRAMTALLLLGPATPMLFQGQEFGSRAPFLYFADHQPALAKLVAAGRRQFLHQFRSLACPECDAHLADPAAESTFEQCKLRWQECDTHSGLYPLHADLLRLRREDPVFSKPRRGGVDGAVLGPQTFLLRYFAEAEQGAEDRLLMVNLGPDLHLDPAPEPFLAPPLNHVWRLHWSSEAPVYGGCGTPPVESELNWRIPGHAAVVLVPTPSIPAPP
jgi:maltooligosyltrehalose trehalohydrolase